MDTKTHGCGGTVLFSGNSETAHVYCDRCNAFNHDVNGDLPTGTDEATNVAAWNAGKPKSPDAE